MSKYFFNGIDINNIIDTTGYQYPGGNYYIGFPTTVTPGYEIEKPLPLSYTISGTDLANSCKALSQKYNTSQTIPVPTGAKYISAICVGGGGAGGGGGGGGGDGVGKQNDGGNGGNGSPGNYSAVFQYSLSGISNLNITVGGGGLGGSGGSDSNNGTGQKGGDGVDGGTSSIINGSIILCDAPGGYHGGGGGSGNKNSNGGNGSNGLTALSGKFSGTGTANYISTYPPQDSGNGTGGTGGNGGNNDGNNGNSGLPGYVKVFFLYS